METKINISKAFADQSNKDNPHYIEKTVVMNIKKLLDPKTKEFARQNCRDLFFTIVLVCRYIAEQEFLKVYDWYEEHNQIKYQNKKWLEAIKKDFNKYNDYLAKHMETRARGLVSDSCNKAYEGLEKLLFDLTLTFKFYYERKGLKDCDIIAQIETARAMINLYDEVFKAHIQIYKDEYHIDFSKSYKEATLNVAVGAMYAFADSKVHYKKNNLHPTRNYASEQAYKAINEKLSDDGFRNQYCLDALRLGHFDKEVKSCELETMGVERLENKFKVTKK